MIAERASWRGAPVQLISEEFAALFYRLYPPYCRLACAILADEMQAEELVMEAFVRLLRAQNRIRDPDRLDAYLRRVVVNLCRSRLRRRAIEQRVNAVVFRRSAIRSAGVAWEDEPSITEGAVWGAIHRLPARQRAAIVLRYYEELPEAEIADVMGCTVGTVKSQLSRARGALAATLSPEET